MRLLLVFFILFCSLKLSAQEYEPSLVGNILLNWHFEQQNRIKIDDLEDLIDKDLKVTRCVQVYIERQSKSYPRQVQNNLYDLIHNFEGIISRITGSKKKDSGIPLEDKLEALAKLQCEIYYSMGILADS